jgi:hypothetical protein
LTYYVGGLLFAAAGELAELFGGGEGRDGENSRPVPVQVQVPAGNGAVAAWPAGYFDQTAGALAGEEFLRPHQGELP